ncbi:MAG: hypothetical protein HBSAPP03_10820 [Phycisphaerae bacterium]|nr:MAG: hypothetical protein HBSAPP03_10820 [Phycisphaerae bacterium]
MAHIHGMDVLLDGEPLRVEGNTLAAAMKAAADAARARGRMIVEMKSDGRPISDDQLANAAGAMEGVGVLSFASADPSALVSQSFVDAAEALGGAMADQMAVADAIAAGQLDDAIEPLQRVIATWQSVREVVDRSSAVLGVRLADVRVNVTEGAATLNEASTPLREALRALRDGMENEDWSAVSDAVGYDLDAQAKEWIVLLRGVAAKVRSSSVGA